MNYKSGGMLRDAVATSCGEIEKIEDFSERKSFFLIRAGNLINVRHFHFR
jgi:hypothetical protein